MTLRNRKRQLRMRGGNQNDDVDHHRHAESSNHDALESSMMRHRWTIRRSSSLILVIIVSSVIILLAVLAPSWKDDNQITATTNGDNTNVDTTIKPATSSSSEPSTESFMSSSNTNQKQYTQLGKCEKLETIPHDATAFTQGLLSITDRSDGSLKFYEGTGMHGQSALRLLDRQGNVLDQHQIPSQYFGEGIVHFPHRPSGKVRILQLTWRERTILEYSIPSNETHSLQVSPPIANFTFQTTKNEGWGITYDPYEDVFYVTDGTEYLHRWNTTTRQEISKITVQFLYNNVSEPQIIRNLNELEFDPISKTVLANVWLKDVIVRIDPKTGFVQTIYDCQALYPRNQRSNGADVFNGIALTFDVLKPQSYPPLNKTNEYWVTGKYWPYMYRVRLSIP